MEQSVVYYFQKLHTPFTNHLSLIISDQLALFIFWLAIFGTLTVTRQIPAKMTGFSIAAASYLYWIGNVLFLKTVFFRYRPYLALPDIQTIGQHEVNSSFPSDHVTTAAFLAFILVWYRREFLYTGIVIVLTVGLSRMFNGMHWPTDVLGGMIIGPLYGYAAIRLTRSAFKQGKPTPGQQIPEERKCACASGNGEESKPPPGGITETAGGEAGVPEKGSDGRDHENPEDT